MAPAGHHRAAGLPQEAGIVMAHSPPPLRFGPDGMPTCDACHNWLTAQGWNIVHAAASVGIEHGKSGAQVIREYLAGYHARRHAEP